MKILCLFVNQRGCIFFKKYIVVLQNKSKRMSDFYSALKRKFRKEFRTFLVVRCYSMVPIIFCKHIKCPCYRFFIIFFPTMHLVMVETLKPFIKLFAKHNKTSMDIQTGPLLPGQFSVKK